MKYMVVLLCFSVVSANVNNVRKFPDDFLFGVATAAYQIEGGWDEDVNNIILALNLFFNDAQLSSGLPYNECKGENIWDFMTHNNPEAITDLTNGDMAADSYHMYKRDVEMMRELGVDVYRFSLSWSRILPDGFANNVNAAGIDYYNNLINEILKYNILPMVTLYHWDLPQKLQELGGFANPFIAKWFEDYARVAFQNFGDRVKIWLTFNEPKEICLDGYGSMAKAPMLNASGIGEYLCAKNLVMAHARAYHAYTTEFKSVQNGQCGITFSVSSAQPLTDSEEDKLALDIQNQGEWGIYADPIFSELGGFPKEFTDRVAMKSAEQGYPRSRLPDFNEEEKAYARGTSDFFGVNHYGGSLVSAGGNHDNAVPSFYDDLGVSYSVPEEWPTSASSWLTKMPNSLYITLTRLAATYNNPHIYVTENGWSTREGLGDDDRVSYFRDAWESALDAIDDGVQLKGYMAWSLMDNFEWNQGYSERFGLYEVDFQGPELTRTPRKSAVVYKHLINTRSVDHSYEPDTYVID